MGVARAAEQGVPHSNNQLKSDFIVSVDKEDPLLIILIGSESQDSPPPWSSHGMFVICRYFRSGCPTAERGDFGAVARGWCSLSPRMDRAGYLTRPALVNTKSTIPIKGAQNRNANRLLSLISSISCFSVMTGDLLPSTYNSKVILQCRPSCFPSPGRLNLRLHRVKVKGSRIKVKGSDTVSGRAPSIPFLVLVHIIHERSGATADSLLRRAFGRLALRLPELQNH